jgi:hypothetical protein
MKTIRFLHLSILAVLIFSLGQALAADPDSPQLTIELRDGSRIVCQSLNQNIRFRGLPSWEMDLPVQDIRSVDCSSNNSATVTMALTGHPILSGTFANSRLAVKTAFGNVDLPVTCIARITVSATPIAVQPGGIRMRAQMIQPMFQGFYDYPDPKGRLPRFAAPGGGSVTLP